METEVKTLTVKMISASLIYNAALICLDAAICPDTSVIAGLIIGMAVCISAILHMARSVWRAVEYPDRDRAGKIVLRAAVARQLLFAVLFLMVLWKFSDKINPLALVAGTMGIKIGAWRGGYKNMHREEEVT